MDQGDGLSPNEENDGANVNNISDVLEAITNTDPEWSMDAMHRHERRVIITEQPASKALRFRYQCEGRSAGSIPGVNSTPERKTYPTIEIIGWAGKAVVVVSCITKDKPYRPHPHHLVGREQCKDGLCTVYVDGADKKVTFNNLGIQCVRRKDIAEALVKRQKQNVDPFKTGFDHKNQPQSIDLNAVRLCFQVFLFDERSQTFRHGLAPAISDVIYDKKAMSDLLIMRMSTCSGSVRGGKEIILLCEKVIREETAVVFFQTENDVRVWEANAHIILVHKQVAIALTTPPYRETTTTEHVRVYIQLRRTTDGVCSPPVEFEYLPDYAADTSYIKSKRRKTMNAFLQSYEQDRFQQELKPIKAEPRDKTPPHQISSPPQMFTQLSFEPEPLPEHQYQQWQMPPEQVQANLSVPGPSRLNPFASDMNWNNPNYAQHMPPISPNIHNLQPVSPSMQSVSPNMQSVSPNMQSMSPNMQSVSPNMQSVSPNMHLSPNMNVSPNIQAMSPMQAVSPLHVMPMNQAMSPSLSPAMSPMQYGGMSPHGTVGHISPNPVQQPDLTQLQTAPMDSTTSNENPSFSRLLLEGGDSMPQLNSTELSGLTCMLDERDDDNISNGFNKLTF